MHTRDVRLSGQIVHQGRQTMRPHPSRQRDALTAPNTALASCRYPEGSARRRRCPGALRGTEDPVVARPARVLAAGAAALFVLTACTSDPEPSPPVSDTPTSSASASASDDLAAFYGQKVRWEGCPSDDGFSEQSKDTFECATLKVPLDYAKPGDGSTELSVLRRTVKNPRGSLILNPGGPGGSGVDYARAARAVLTPQLAGAYDVVGFDPRGVVSSRPGGLHRRLQARRALRLRRHAGHPAGGRRPGRHLEAVRRGLQVEVARGRPVHGHRVRGARHGHPARGPRRREAELPGQELRHLPGRPVRGAVPRQGRAGW